MCAAWRQCRRNRVTVDQAVRVCQLHSHQLIRHDAQSRTEPHVTRITVSASGSARYDLGSRGYARGELRAEIRSDLTGCRLGPGHDPSRRAGFAAEWANALREDPREIY